MPPIEAPTRKTFFLPSFRSAFVAAARSAANLVAAAPVRDLRETVAAEVHREDEVAPAREATRVRKPVAEVARGLVRKDHGGRALAEPVADELRSVGREEQSSPPRTHECSARCVAAPAVDAATASTATRGRRVSCDEAVTGLQ